MGAREDYERAREVAPYGKDELVLAATRYAMSHGHHVLQIHRLAETERAHVLALLELFDPPPHARVLDAGCGVGRVADIMRQARPDLDFALLNVSPAQLALCSPDLEQIHGSFHEIPLGDASLDAAMYLYSMGHGLLETVLAEAARVVRPGGVLFVYDIAARDPRRLIELLGYVAHDVGDVFRTARRHGFHLTLFDRPRTSTEAFEDLVGPEVFRSTMEGVEPVIYRFERA